MGVTTLQINLNTERMIDLSKIRRHRGISIQKGDPGYASDDMLAKLLLCEKIDEELTAIQS